MLRRDSRADGTAVGCSAAQDADPLALTGTILVSELTSGNKSYVLAMISLAALALTGLAAAMLLPAWSPSSATRRLGADA